MNKYCYFRNNLANVCFHEKDFKIKVVSYNFFATSHGKNPCDAIGGTIKRTVMRHCLRSTPDNQITSPKEMYDYALENIKNIRYVISSELQYFIYDK